MKIYFSYIICTCVIVSFFSSNQLSAKSTTINEYPLIEIFLNPLPKDDNRLIIYTNDQNKIMGLRIGGSLGDFSTVPSFQATLEQLKTGFFFKSPRGLKLLYAKTISLNETGGIIAFSQDKNRAAEDTTYVFIQNINNYWIATEVRWQDNSWKNIMRVNKLDLDGNIFFGITEMKLYCTNAVSEYWVQMKKIGYYPNFNVPYCN